MRYAVYHLPPRDSVLARCGAVWLGWDVHAGEEVERAAEAKPEWVASPRCYGFHATLKPPFRLAKGQVEADLLAAAEQLAATMRPVDLGLLELSQIGSFLALTAPQAGPELNERAGSCVMTLDPFRAPATQDELAKRRMADLDDRGRSAFNALGLSLCARPFPVSHDGHRCIG
jgi:hypothetical protein